MVESVTLADVRAAAARLEGYARRTPVMTSRRLDERVGAQVFLKCEHLQHIGAFKFRGAFNAISQLDAAERARGVVAYSSGNHAQAVARVSQMLGVQATIVMPQDAPAMKIAATRGYGATVITYDPHRESREAIAQRVAGEQGAVLIPPFDHPHVIAGQGTAALELIEEVGPLDMLFVCVGGGGLISGCAIAAKGLSPDCEVIGIEPEVADDATRSFYTRTLQTVEHPPTIADGTRTASLGGLTFPLVLQYVDGMRTVSEAQIKHAVRYGLTVLKQVIEPSGALSLAGVLNTPVRGRVGVIVSGGNLDMALLRDILTEDLTAD